ncbi:MAG: TadE family protein [Pseudomonadota bacterium]
MNCRNRTSYKEHQTGATLVEFVIVTPTLLFMLMMLIQLGLMYHAKSQVNYATFEAARAGATGNANAATIKVAFDRAMTGYYGGGTTTGELATSFAKAVADSTVAARIEILSPTKESFEDFNSPMLASKLGASRVIPNSNLAFISCPVDVPGCNTNPAGNQSGQTLQDANLLKLRITYGIPKAKQIPLAGPFLNKILGFLNASDSDLFRAGLVAAGRIPVVAHTVMRMQSPAIEGNNASSPGPGNAGTPIDPGPLPPGPQLPTCPVTNPTCVPTPPVTPGPTCPNGASFCPVCH